MIPLQGGDGDDIVVLQHRVWCGGCPILPMVWWMSGVVDVCVVDVVQSSFSTKKTQRIIIQMIQKATMAINKRVIKIT